MTHDHGDQQRDARKAKNPSHDVLAGAQGLLKDREDREEDLGGDLGGDLEEAQEESGAKSQGVEVDKWNRQEGVVGKHLVVVVEEEEEEDREKAALGKAGAAHTCRKAVGVQNEEGGEDECRSWCGCGGPAIQMTLAHEGA